MALASIKNTASWLESTGKMTAQVRRWVEAVTNFQIIESTGSPEGVLSAKANREYRDTSATNPGTDKYIKRFDEVGGDTTLGWVLVSGLSGTGDRTVVTAVDYQVLLGNININCTAVVTVTAIAFGDAVDDITISATSGIATFAASVTIEGGGAVASGSSVTWYPAGSQWWRK